MRVCCCCCAPSSLPFHNLLGGSLSLIHAVVLHRILMPKYSIYNMTTVQWCQRAIRNTRHTITKKKLVLTHAGHTYRSSWRKLPYNRTLIASLMRPECVCESVKNFTINFPARFRVVPFNWRALVFFYFRSVFSLGGPLFSSTLSFQVSGWSFAENKNSTLLSVLLLEYKLFIVATWINEHPFLMNTTMCRVSLSFLFFIFFLLSSFWHVWIPSGWKCKNHTIPTSDWKNIELIIKKSNNFTENWLETTFKLGQLHPYTPFSIIGYALNMRHTHKHSQSLFINDANARTTREIGTSLNGEGDIKV